MACFVWKNYKERKTEGHGGCLATLLVTYLKKVEDQAGVVQCPNLVDGYGLICAWNSTALYSRCRQEIIRLQKSAVVEVKKHCGYLYIVLAEQSLVYAKGDCLFFSFGTSGG